MERATHTITIQCRCLQVTASGYYAWRRRPESQRTRDDRRLTVLVRASFDASRQRYGSPRIHEDLREQHEAISRKRGQATPVDSQTGFLLHPRGLCERVFQRLTGQFGRRFETGQHAENPRGRLRY